MKELLSSLNIEVQSMEYNQDAFYLIVLAGANGAFDRRRPNVIFINYAKDDIPHEVVIAHELGHALGLRYNLPYYSNGVDLITKQSRLMEEVTANRFAILMLNHINAEPKLMDNAESFFNLFNAMYCEDVDLTVALADADARFARVIEELNIKIEVANAG